MFFSGLENRLFEARLRAEFTIFPLKNISIQLFTIGPYFLSKETRGGYLVSYLLFQKNVITVMNGYS